MISTSGRHGLAVVLSNKRFRRYINISQHNTNIDQGIETLNSSKTLNFCRAYRRFGTMSSYSKILNVDPQFKHSVQIVRYIWD